MIIVIPDLTAARTLQVNEILKCNRPCNQFLGSYCYITIKFAWKSDKYLDRNFQEKDKVAFFLHEGGGVYIDWIKSEQNLPSIWQAKRKRN